jgi:RHS repeat-associated protein
VKVTIAGDTSANNGTYLVAWNGHGDATALWKIDLSSGALTLANSYTYTSWGQPTTATHNGIGNLGFRYLYVGRFRVAWDGFAGASLAHMGARHYSPVLGRFLQPDPSAAEANLYAYAENDPVTKVDPSGHCLRCIIDSLVRLAERVRSGLPGFIRTIQNWLQFQFRSFPGSTTFIPRIQQSIRVIGSHPRNFHIVSSGARSGYWRFTSVLQGGGE